MVELEKVPKVGMRLRMWKVKKSGYKIPWLSKHGASMILIKTLTQNCTAGTFNPLFCLLLASLRHRYPGFLLWWGYQFIFCLHDLSFHWVEIQFPYQDTQQNCGHHIGKPEGRIRRKKEKPCYAVNLPKDNSQLGQVVPAVTPRCWKHLLSCLPQRLTKTSFPMLTSTLGTPGFLRNPTRRGFSWLIPHWISLGQTYKRQNTLKLSEQAQHPFPRNTHTHTQGKNWKWNTESH